MSGKKPRDNSLVIAIVAAVVVVGLVVVAAAHLRFPGRTVKAEPIKTPNPPVVVTRVDSDKALSLQVELYDPKPLFLPTPINSSDPALPANLQREPGSVFKPIPPRLTFTEYEMKVPLPEPIAVPPSPFQAIRVGDQPVPFYGMGYVNYPFTPLSPRLGYLEVVQAGSGKVVLSAPLALAPKEKFPAADWNPLEMVVAVSPFGLVGDPEVTNGSESEDVDSFFRTFLVRDFNLGARLAPGFYTLRVGP